MRLKLVHTGPHTEEDDFKFKNKRGGLDEIRARPATLILIPGLLFGFTLNQGFEAWYIMFQTSNSNLFATKGLFLRRCLRTGQASMCATESSFLFSIKLGNIWPVAKVAVSFAKHFLAGSFNLTSELM